MFDRIAFARRVVEFRIARGLSQFKLADAARISRSYLSRLESVKASQGMNPSLGTIEKIADVFGTDIRAFFAGIEDSSVIFADPFIVELAPYVRKLSVEQRELIMRRLAAIEPEGPLKLKPGRRSKILGAPSSGTGV